MKVRELYTTESFKKLIESKYKGLFITDNLVYNGVFELVNVSCVKHGDVSIRASAFLYQKTPCRMCHDEKRSYYANSYYRDKYIEINKDIVQPLDHKIIKTFSGDLVLVDNEDYERVREIIWGTGGKSGLYASNYTYGFIHRFIMDCPENLYIDHINGNGLDNRRSNLRLCTQAENMRNIKNFLKKNKTSIYKGVFFAKHANKWRARITIDGKSKHLGYFDDEIKAAEAYDKSCISIFGSFGNPNFACSVFLTKGVVSSKYLK